MKIKRILKKPKKTLQMLKTGSPKEFFILSLETKPATASSVQVHDLDL